MNGNVYPSTTSLSSTLTATSTTPLRPTSGQKDYAAAFADLQSTYGFAGNSLAPVAKKPKHRDAALTASHPTPAHPPQKDYASAFARLSSSYGYSGAAPSVPRKSPTTRAQASRAPQPTAPTSPQDPTPAGRDYESAFAALSSSYGPGGTAPSLPSKSKKSHSFLKMK